MSGCILVFGMPRSGTTWVGKLLDSHPDTLYRHEPDSVKPLTLPLFPEQAEAPRARAELEQFVASLPSLRSPKVVAKQPLFPKHYQSSAGLIAYRAGALAARAASRVARNFPCLGRPTGRGHADVRLVWKSIESFGRLGVCIQALPDARAIHLMRHPCGQIASTLRGEATHRFGAGKTSAEDPWKLRRLLATSTGKGRGLRLDDIKYLAPEERLAWTWVLAQEKILADVGDCERVLTVRYEDVCARPTALTRRMFEFTSLGWHPQTEAFIHASTHGSDADYYSVFKNQQAPAERWRSELAPDAIARIMRIVRGSPMQRFYDDAVPATAPLAEVAK